MESVKPKKIEALRPQITERTRQIIEEEARKEADLKMKEIRYKRQKEQIEQDHAIEAIKITIPDGLSKELSLPESMLDQIKVEIRREEFGEKVKLAKKKIIEASGIIKDDQEVEKAKGQYKDALRKIKFKLWEIENEVIEKDETITTLVKPKWTLYTEIDALRYFALGYKETLEAYGVDVIPLEKEVEEQINESRGYI